LLSDLIAKSKVGVKDSNPESSAKVKEAADRLRYPIAQAKAIVAPQFYQLLEEKIRKAKADLADVRSLNRENDFAKVRAALGPLNVSAGDVVAQIKQGIPLLVSQTKAMQLEKAANNLENLIQQKRPEDSNGVDDYSNKVDGALDDILKQINNIQAEDFKSFEEQASTPLGAFERAIAEVALNVKRSIQVPYTLEQAKALSEELAKLAAAAKSGKRQEMIMAGRNIADLIKALVKQLLELAKQVASKDPIYQDKLITLAHALQNYSTQLKIMISVRASSDQDRDAEESLASITRSLGNALTEAISTASIVKTAILK